MDNVRDDDELSNDEQEQHFEAEINEIDAIQNIKSDILTTPGTAEMMQQTSTTQHRFGFLSKLPYVIFIRLRFIDNILPFANSRFFRKSKKPAKPKVRRLKVFEILRYADKIDILIMIVGCIAG